MNIIDKNNAYIVEIAQNLSVMIGVTKNTLEGSAPDRDILTALSFYGKNFDAAWMEQPHGAAVKEVSFPGVYKCDGLFTKSENLALIVRTADCMPIIFYSKEEGVIGVVHMGWRSADAGILDNIGYDLSSFTVIAGAGMRICCYKVGKEFLAYPEMKHFIENRAGKHYFDPIGFILEKLSRKGLKKANFIDMNICSYCSGNDFFSYRNTKTTNRTLSFVMKIKR